MSEKNKRGAAVNGPGKVGAVKVTPGADGNKFSVALIKLASGFEKLCKDAGGLEEYQQVLDSRTGLHQELEQQKREMQELNRRMNDIQQQKDEEVGQLQSELSESNRSIEILLHQFGGKYMDWDADKSQHDKESAELSQLKDELERTQNEAKISKSETKRLQEELNKTEKQLEKEINSTDTLKNRLQRKILECEEATNRLNKYETKLKKMQNDLGILRIDESQV
jgi:predicted  nucleic acid-binding Zn-ribbon protein